MRIPVRQVPRAIPRTPDPNSILLFACCHRDDQFEFLMISVAVNIFTAPM